MTGFPVVLYDRKDSLNLVSSLVCTSIGSRVSLSMWNRTSDEANDKAL